MWVLFSPEPVELRAELPLNYRGIGRLAPGVGIEAAEAMVTRLVGDLRASLPDAPGRFAMRPLKEDLVASFRGPLVLLTLGGTLVLLVAALNLSLLMAGRNVERREELQIRAALGASRGRLLRHLLSEACVLALIGGALAVTLAILLLDRVFEIGSGTLGRLAGAEMGPAVVLVGLAAAIVPTLFAAALPALRIAGDVRGRSARVSSMGRSGRRLARALSGVESALVFALLVVAALVLRSLQEVTAVEPGFDTTSTVALEVFLPGDERVLRDSEAFSTFLVAVEERLGALPGVRAAGTVTNLPLSLESWSGNPQIEGRENLGGQRGVVVDWELTSPSYFEAIGIPVQRGRDFDERDRVDAPPVAVINETMARRMWPDGDPVGARISGGGPLRTVIGVVADVKQQGLHVGTRGFMYLPALQLFPASSRHQIVVRVEGDYPASVVSQVRAALLEIEPDLAVGRVRTLDALVRESSGSFRLRAVLLGVFAAMALLLGMAGIYGVTAHSVRTRRRDIGIRIAVGADGGRIMNDVLTEGLMPVALGLAGGLGLVLIAAPVLRGLLFGVGAGDPWALLGIGALLLTSAMGAVLPSALRARRIDPVTMLRDE